MCSPRLCILLIGHSGVTGLLLHMLKGNNSVFKALPLAVIQDSENHSYKCNFSFTTKQKNTNWPIRHQAQSLKMYNDKKRHQRRRTHWAHTNVTKGAGSRSDCLVIGQKLMKMSFAAVFFFWPPLQLDISDISDIASKVRKNNFVNLTSSKCITWPFHPFSFVVCLQKLQTPLFVSKFLRVIYFIVF